MAELVGAIDQGTTSTRFMVFDNAGREVGRHQLELPQILPRPGWVEHDPAGIWEGTCAAVARVMADLGLRAGDLAAVGVTNQRETTIAWDRRSGRPLANAIVWQDTRTDRIAAELGLDHRGKLIETRSGLRPSTYFSGGKLRWLLEHVDGLRPAAERGDALFGTVDSWLLWNLTGGSHGGRHATDVTNASRTMLMDLRRRQWDDDLLDVFTVPPASLPELLPSSDPDRYGVTTPDGPFGGEVVLAADLGDQHAATVGQVCFDPGQAKNTYGTGNFLLLNTGEEVVASPSGLVTTMAYELGGYRPAYALEGSIAVTGSAVQWLRDQLGIISHASDIEGLARQVDDTGGAAFVPAFSGLFAPRWRSDARGAIVGLTRATTKAHLARATLEAICYQTREVTEAMATDAGVAVDVLRVDGGVTANELCMQLQADILGMPVSRPVVSETTALGAAYAAGLAVGFWDSLDDLRANWQEDRRWEPTWSEDRREDGYARWKSAVERTLDWVSLD